MTKEAAMARGPMAKHPSARARSNTHSTAREIVLRSPDDELLPVPPLPEREVWVDEGGLPTLGRKDAKAVAKAPMEWHPQVQIAWAQMWQYPLVYEAPAVDQHLLLVYVDLLQDYWERAEKGRSRNEIARDLRAYAELWGIGEKCRRHLQITIQQAKEAMERGRKADTQYFDQPAPEATAGAYTPRWSDDDEDSGEIADVEVVG